MFCSSIARSLVGAVVVVSAAFAAFGDELAIARGALREGLWDVARAHAAKSEDPGARIVIAESFAREGKWKELLDAVEGWNNPEDERLLYYRALALAETGKMAQAGFAISDRKFSDPAYMRLATRLKARVAMSEKGAAEALKIMKEAPEALADEDSEMFAADLMAATGDRTGAENIWRVVAARGTNASERAFAFASVNLGDEKLLREAFERSVSAEMKRKAGYARHILCPRPHIFLLTASEQYRADHARIRQIQSTYAFRPMDLVPAERHQIDLVSFREERYLAKSLNCV